MNKLLDILLASQHSLHLGLVSCAFLPCPVLPDQSTDMPWNGLTKKMWSLPWLTSESEEGLSITSDHSESTLAASGHAKSPATLRRGRAKERNVGAQKLHALVSWVRRKRAAESDSPIDDGAGRLAVLPVLSQLEAQRDDSAAAAWDWRSTAGFSQDFVVWNILELAMLADFPSRTQVCFVRNNSCSNCFSTWREEHAVQKVYPVAGYAEQCGG